VIPNNCTILQQPYKKNQQNTAKFNNQLTDNHINTIFSVYYPQIIALTTICQCGYRGAFNIHPAKLPEYRGAHILNWLMIEGLTSSHVTLHTLEAGIDEGDIVKSLEYKIKDNDTINDVIATTFTTATKILIDFKP